MSLCESLGALWGLLIVYVHQCVSGIRCVSVCLDTLLFIPVDVEVCVCVV